MDYGRIQLANNIFLQSGCILNSLFCQNYVTIIFVTINRELEVVRGG